MKGLCKKICEWVYSRLGESVSDLYRAKIRLGEFTAVYSTSYNPQHCYHTHHIYMIKSATNLKVYDALFLWINIYTSSVFCYDKYKKNFDIQFSMKRHESV